MAENTNEIISRLLGKSGGAAPEVQDEEAPRVSTPISFNDAVKTAPRFEQQESTMVAEQPAVQPAQRFGQAPAGDAPVIEPMARRMGGEAKSPSELFFPSVAKAPTLGRKIAGGVSDVLTMAPRMYYGGKRAMEAPPGEAVEGLEKGMSTESSGFVESVAKNPKTTAALAAGIATGGAGLLPTLAAEGAAVIGAGQAKNIAEEGELDLGEAGIDALITTLTPAIGGSLSAVGKKIFTSALKAPKAALKSVKAGKHPAGSAAQLTEDTFKHKMAGSFSKFSRKVDDKLSNLDATLDASMAKNIREVDAAGILNNAEKSIEKVLKKGEGPSALFQDAKAVKRQISFERKNLEEISKSGKLTPQQFRKWKTSLGKKGQFNVLDNQTMASKKAASNQIFESARKYQIDNVPGAKEINKEMSELIPISIALKDAAIRTGKNFPIGLRETIAAIPAVAGHAGSGLGLVSGIRATSSPVVGATLGKTGGAILKSQKGTLGTLSRRGLGQLTEEE